MSRSRRPKQSTYPDWDAIAKFNTLYNMLINETVKVRVNLHKFLTLRRAELDSPSTVIGQLQRIADFLFESDHEDNNITKLFDRKDGVLSPTPLARNVYRKFQILSDLFYRLKSDVDEDNVTPTPIIRVGTPQTIGLRLMSAIFSDWKNTFGNVAHLEVEIATTSELIPRLNAELLDFVIAYGREGSRQGLEGTEVTFRSLGYETNLVLLAHAEERLHCYGQKKKKGINEGYWQDKETYDRGKKRPAFASLRSVELEDIDFTKTKLIYVPSFGYPDRLINHVKELRSNLPGQVIEVPWYDEALARVMMGHGVAITAEVFAKLGRGVTAFSLRPKDEYLRWVGVYYHGRKELDEVSRRLVECVRHYMDFCETEMRAGSPPAYDDQRFLACRKDFEKTKSWENTEGQYPAVIKPIRNSAEDEE